MSFSFTRLFLSVARTTRTRQNRNQESKRISCKETLNSENVSFVCVFCSLEEECEAPLCTSALKTKNREIQNDMKKLTAVFDKLKSYVGLLAVPSKYRSPRVAPPQVLLNERRLFCAAGVRLDAMCQSSANAVFTQLSAGLHGLHDVTRGEMMSCHALDSRSTAAVSCLSCM